MNSVNLVGRMTKDPELRFIPNSGTAVARFGIAVNREYSKEKEADFFNVVVFGKSAENCGQYLKKGLLVGVSGNIRNNNYEDKNGTKHFNNEIHAQKVEFLEWANDAKTENPKQSKPQEQKTQSSYQDDFSGFQAIDGDDDIPF